LILFLHLVPLSFGCRDYNRVHHKASAKNGGRISRHLAMPLATDGTVLEGPMRQKIPRAVWILGFVSMCMDISSELIHSLLPVFMVSSLAATAMDVGLVEGVAEATALITKVFSGTLSDYFKQRKLLAVLGYGLGAFSKPLFAVASSIHAVLAARFIDRIGKGIRGAPRDALVADLTPASIQGAAYGLRQSLDTVGAFIGPCLAIILMIVWHGNFRRAFWFAMVPGFAAVLLLSWGVHEPEAASRKTLRGNPIHWRMLKDLGAAYWGVVAIGTVFTLARFSEAFLILRVRQVGLPDAWTPLVFVLMNVVYAAVAYPAGHLADRMNRRSLLAVGIIVLAIAEFVLGFAGTLMLSALGIALWGLHLGLVQGLLSAMIAAVAPSSLRGTAFGFFNLASGVAMLIASGLAGLLWDALGSSATFNAGAVFSMVALLLIILLSKPKAQNLKSEI
jgi:MFS family permease